jgi:hypothetical protein
MTTRIALLALTALLAGASAPAMAGGLSINIGTPAEFVHFDNYRYHHDRGYRDRYDRWRAQRDHRDHGGDHRDDHHDHH